jgi:hypothetical protein
MRPGFLLLILALGAAAAPAAAQQPAPAVAQTPARTAPEGLEYFVGAWLAEARDPTTGESFSLVYRVEPALGGAWITGYGESPELGFKSRDMWGRDLRTGEIMRVIFNDGGGYATVRSPGWKGDTLVLEGESHGRNAPLRLRETITRVSASEFRAVWEALRDGVWTAYSVERLTRQSET